MLVLVGFVSEQDSCSLTCLVVVEQRNQAWAQPGVAAAPLYCSAPIAVAVVEDVSGTAAGPLVADFAGSEKERLAAQETTLQNFDCILVAWVSLACSSFLASEGHSDCARATLSGPFAERRRAESVVGFEV